MGGHLFRPAFGGAILIAINYLRLGEGATLAAFTILVGLVATGLVMLFVSLLPWGQVALMLDAMILLFTMKYAKAIQGSSIEEHKSRGGRLASLWAALGIGAAALAFNALAVWVIYTGGHIRPSAPASGDLHPDKVGVATLDAKVAESLETLRARGEHGDPHAQLELGNLSD